MINVNALVGTFTFNQEKALRDCENIADKSFAALITNHDDDCSGALSTVSSGLNSLSAVCITDLLQLGCSLDISDARKTIISKLVSLLFGVLSFGLVFLMKYVPGILSAAIGLFGMVGGPILGRVLQF